METFSLEKGMKRTNGQFCSAPLKDVHPIVMLLVYTAVALTVPGGLMLKANHPMSLPEAPFFLPFLGPAAALGLVSLLRRKDDPRPLGDWCLKVVYLLLAVGTSAIQWFMDFPPLLLYFAAPFYVVTGLVTGIAAGFLGDYRGWKGAMAVWLWLWAGVVGYFLATVGGLAIAPTLGVPIWGGL